MPVIPKPAETKTLLDYLYQNSDIPSPAPLIAREALLKAALAALPAVQKTTGSYLLENVLKNITHDTIMTIPKKHVSAIKKVDVISPVESIALSPEKGSMVRAYYFPSEESIALVRGMALPQTIPHEVGHNVFYIANPKNIIPVIEVYDKIPVSNLTLLSEYGKAVIDDPAELFAQLYSMRIMNDIVNKYGMHALKQVGAGNPRKFLELIRKEYPALYNIPYRMPPYSGLF